MFDTPTPSRDSPEPADDSFAVDSPGSAQPQRLTFDVLKQWGTPSYHSEYTESPESYRSGSDDCAGGCDHEAILRETTEGLARLQEQVDDIEAQHSAALAKVAHELKTAKMALAHALEEVAQLKGDNKALLSTVAMFEDERDARLTNAAEESAPGKGEVQAGEVIYYPVEQAPWS